jgi:hypothetical protein
MGLLLVLGGALLLLQSLNLLRGTWENAIWTVVFGAVGIYCLTLFFTNRKNWWWLLPGIILLGMAVSNLLELVFPQADYLSGVIILGGIGIAFIAVYLNDRVNWWALIPGGVLLTLGVVSLVDEANLVSFDSSAIFFFGLGLTFFVLYLIPTPYGRLKWAIFPALPLLLVAGFLAFQSQAQVWEIAGPAIIIIAGLYFLISAMRK